MTLLRSFGRSAADPAGTLSSQSRTAGILALLPLGVLAAVFWWRPLAAPEAAMISAGLSYGAALIALTNGLRWGMARLSPAGLIVTLAALASLLMPPAIGLVLLVAMFFLNALIHVTAVERGLLPYWFGSLTSLLTAGAVVALLAIMVRLLI
ncbi:hypothetical protein BH10PSE7_BH10PSE7_17590 [soil metagenome]